MSDDPVIALADSIESQIADLIAEIRKSDDQGKAPEGHLVVPRWTITAFVGLVTAAILALASFVYDISNRMTAEEIMMRNVVEQRLRSQSENLRDYRLEFDGRIDRLEGFHTNGN